MVLPVRELAIELKDLVGSCWDCAW